MNDSTDQVWWCESHQRVATHIAADGRRHCDPALGGILLPCNVVFKSRLEIECEHTTVLDCNPPRCGLCGKILDE